MIYEVQRSPIIYGVFRVTCVLIMPRALIDYKTHKCVALTGNCSFIILSIMYRTNDVSWLLLDIIFIQDLISHCWLNEYIPQIPLITFSSTFYNCYGIIFLLYYNICSFIRREMYHVYISYNTLTFVLLLMVYKKIFSQPKSINSLLWYRNV